MDTALAADRVDRSLAKVEELSLHAILGQFGIEIEAHSSDSKRWVVRLEDAEFKDSPDSGTLHSFVGSGRSTEVALVELCDGISGKLMVIGAMPDERTEIQLPRRVTLD